MKPEECKKSKKELGDVCIDILRVHSLFSVLIRGIEMNGEYNGKEINALDAAMDYFNHIMEDFSIVMDP